MEVLRTIGYVFVGAGVGFMVFGILGIFRFKNFYLRLLSGSKIDTVALLTVCMGILFIKGFDFFSLRVILLMGIIAVLNPLVSHMMTRMAYLSNYKLGEYGEDLLKDGVKNMDDGVLELPDKIETEEQAAKDLYDIHE